MKDIVIDGKPKQESVSKIAIVGYGASRHDCPFDDPSIQLWGINSLYETYPDKPWAAWFNLHTRTEITDNDKKWLMGMGRNAYCLQQWLDIPGVSVFPAEEIRRFYAPFNFYGDEKETYWTSSMQWMCGFAGMLGVQELHVYGIDLVSNIEYAAQRPGVEGMLRFLQGRGVKIVLPKSCALFRTSWEYGYEQPDYSELQKIHIELRERLRATIAEYQKAADKANTLHGARLELRHQIQTTLLKLRAAGADPGPVALGDYNDDLEAIAQGE